MSTSVPEPHETHNQRVAAVVISLAAGLLLLPPTGAIAAIGFAIWVKQRRTRLTLLAIAAAYTIISLFIL